MALDDTPRVFLKQGQDMTGFRIEVVVDVVEELLQKQLQQRGGMWYRCPKLRQDLTDAFDIIRNQALWRL